MASFQGEEELNHEFKELLVSLPRERGWRTEYIYQYQGFWYSADILKSVMASQQHFQACDTDVLLVTMPKSGTTWLKSLVFAVMNRSHYNVTSKNHPLLTSNPHDLIPFLETNVHLNDPCPTNHSKIPSPMLFATHIPYILLPESIKNSNCRIIYLCRNPKDTFISLWYFMNKLRPQCLGKLSLEEALELFCMGAVGYGPFWDHVLGYWKESLERPQKVLFLKYEEMKRDITSQLKKLAEYLGCPFSMEEEKEGVIHQITRLCSFENLSNLEVNKNGKTFLKVGNNAFFRRGEVGDWVNHLTPSMVEQLDQVMEQKLCGSGLTFQDTNDGVGL